MVEKTINIMGGEVYIYLNIKDKYLEDEILDFVINKIKKLVNIFNFYDKNSYLSRLNENKNLDFQKDLVFLLKKSLFYYKISNGKFNIFLGKEIKKRKKKNISDINMCNKDVNICNKNEFKINNINENNYKLKNIYRKDYDKLIIFDKIEKKIKINSDVNLDLGGIAKGYIIDRVVEEVLYKYKKKIIDIIIDARGDIVCYGKNKKIIEVENPFSSNIKFNEFEIKNGAVITSGHNKQYFKDGSHIVGDETDILTISLKSEKNKCYELDALGTYFIQLNSQKVLEKIEFEDEFKDIECLLILKTGKVLKSSFW